MDWGALIAATLTIYRRAAKETVEKFGRGWWVALLPLVYTPLIILAATFFGRLGLVGGLLVGLVMVLCTSSYLYFIDGIVHGQRVQPQELLDSWRPHFGSVISILFFLMLIRLLFSMMSGGAGAQALYVVDHLLLPILLSPVTEVIYQGRTDGFAMLQESFEFLRESGVEWFVPLVGLVVMVSILAWFPTNGPGLVALLSARYSGHAHAVGALNAAALWQRVLEFIGGDHLGRRLFFFPLRGHGFPWPVVSGARWWDPPAAYFPLPPGLATRLTQWGRVLSPPISPLLQD